MRKSLGRALIASVLLSFFLPAPAQAATVNYNCGTSGTYQVDNVTNTVTGHTSCVGALNIQSGVTSIANYAFSSNANLTTITFPSSLTTIGTGSFSGATFTAVNFAEGLTSIGTFGFANSPSQIALYFPNSLTSVGDRAFDQSQFTSFSFGPNVSTFGSQLFYNNFGAGALSIEFRDGSPLIPSIGSTTFIGFRGGEITLPKHITSIGVRAFEGASNLRYLIVPDSVTTISQSALTPTSSLRTVVLPSGLTTLGTTVFGSAIQTVVYCGSTSAVQNYAYPNSVVPVCGKAAIFEPNGGSGTMNAQVRTTAGALTTNGFNRSGYVFNGWNTKADGTGVSYSNTANYNFSSHIVLYAQWTVPDVTAPTFLTTTAQSKSENQSTVTNILVNESATISINGGSDQVKFSLSRVADSATTLLFISAPDFESPTDSDANNTYIVALRATDGSGNIGYETYTVTITDIAEQIAVVASSFSRTLQKGVANNLSLTFDSAVKATFLFNGKKIAGCVGKPSAISSPFTVTCSFKPTVHGAGTLSVRYSEISGINYGGTTSLGSVGVVKRSNRR